MSNSWWETKLGGGTPQPRPYTPQPQYPTPPVGQPAVPYQNPELAGRLIPASATNASRCPNCASGNYGQTSPEAKARCYDCGYPLQQSGSGTPGVRTSPGGGAVQATRQISTANNYNPGQIIDRIN